ncbi:MAG: heavy metal translocating P-type ATPase [Firmicutes bacterium]|nr:heavy metal translocating P-type ATPase [Bacillota bacterium]
MKNEYRLKGLGCANCASKIENMLKEMKEVKSVTLHFVTATLKIEFEQGFFENQNEAISMIEKTAKKFESGIKVTAKSKSKEEKGKKWDFKTKFHLIRLVVGVVLLAIGLTLQYAVGIAPLMLLWLFIPTYVFLGYDVVIKAVRSMFKGQIFNENFLMALATIGAFAIGKYAEAVGVVLFFQVGDFFQGLAVNRAKNNIENLMDIRPDFAWVKTCCGALVKREPEDVKIEDIIVVKAGERIPLDGIVVDGDASLDMAALTGESVPRGVKSGDAVLSGSVNQNGLLTISVSKIYADSTVSKIIELVQNATEKKAPTETFITKFAKYYTPFVMLAAFLIATLPPLFLGISNNFYDMSWTYSWYPWVSRALIFLVISCPCALVLSIPLGFFGGIGRSAREGVLVKGGNYLDALNKVRVVVFDKTGTLTKGVFEVVQIETANGFSEEEVLKIAAYAESMSNHPIAQSIVKCYDKEIDREKLSEYFEIAGHGISIQFDGKKTIVGNMKLMNKEGIGAVESCGLGTKVYVAVEEKFVGCLTINDQIKEDSKRTIAELKTKGIKTVMLTGDTVDVAKTVGEELGVDTIVGGLLPHQKVEEVEKIKSTLSKKEKLMFVGDGINDAPVLALADIGVAMGGIGSDAAIEVADVVLMTDEPSKLLSAFRVAKKTKNIVWQNIIVSLVVKVAFLGLGAVGVSSLWEAVFADVGVSLLAVLNTLRIFRAKKQNNTLENSNHHEDGCCGE